MKTIFTPSKTVLLVYPGLVSAPLFSQQGPSPQFRKFDFEDDMPGTPLAVSVGNVHQNGEEQAREESGEEWIALLQIAELENDAFALQAEDPGKAAELLAFCQFHKAIIKIQGRQGGYFELTTEEKETLREIEESGLMVKANAVGIRDFIEER